MFTTDPVVESIRTFSRRLVVIEGILAILIPLSRPLGVPQLKIAHKTIFYPKHNFWSHVYRQVMCTNMAAN